MTQLILDEAMVREPNLWVPGRKPVGPVEADSSTLPVGTIGYWPLTNRAGSKCRAVGIGDDWDITGNIYWDYLKPGGFYFSNSRTTEFEISNNPLNGVTAFTIIFKIVPWSCDISSDGFFQAWDGTTNQILIRSTSGGHLQVHTHAPDYVGGDVNLQMTAKTDHIIAVTWDGTTVRPYLDWVAGTTQSQSGTLTSPSSGLRFGGGSGSASEYDYSGYLYWAIALDRAMSLSEMKAFANDPYSPLYPA